jgi:hypothetical protein
MAPLKILMRCKWLTITVLMFSSSYGAQHDTSAESLVQTIGQIRLLLDGISPQCIDKTTVTRALLVLQSGLEAKGSTVPLEYADSIMQTLNAWQTAVKLAARVNCINAPLLVTDLSYKAQDYEMFRGPRLVPVMVSPIKAGKILPNWQVVAQWTDGSLVGIEIPLRKISGVDTPAVGELAPGAYYLTAKMGTRSSRRQYALIGGTKEYEVDIPIL